MSSVLRVGASWRGLSQITHLFIFGDSYSSVGADFQPKKVPTTANPLGTVFPGLTYNESGKPNWVGHFITKYRPGPLFDPAKSQQDQAYLDHPLLIHDYATGGATVNIVMSQIRRHFLENAGKKPEWAPWTAEDSLFVTWVGINDCAYQKTHQDNLKRLFSGLELVYQTGARNFMFVDVPPIQRSPAGTRGHSKSTSYDNWNIALSDAVNKFITEHSDSTVLVYSSAATFNKILDEPVSLGFKAEDVDSFGGTIWCDLLHPTSQVHDVVAREIAQFLEGIPPSNQQEVEVPPNTSGL